MRRPSVFAVEDINDASVMSLDSTSLPRAVKSLVTD
jgi:hypothetical protein